MLEAEVTALGMKSFSGSLPKNASERPERMNWIGILASRKR